MAGPSIRNARLGSKLASGLLAVVALLACATTRGTLDVGIGVPPNPDAGMAVRQPVVSDARRFEANPRDPSIPSLKNASEIGDETLTSRAIARKRNSYGMAMGDILLPEGRTVVGLASDAIVRGFREAGYRVLAHGDPGFEGALPVEARVDQFWAWVTPGFWAMAIEFETRMHIEMPAGHFEKGQDVRGYIRLKSAAVSSEKWRTTIDRGLEDFSTSLASAVRDLEPASAEEPSEVPGDAEIEACFQSCKRLTSRSDEECFDACR